jgi:hypothetical protein
MDWSRWRQWHEDSGRRGCPRSEGVDAPQQSYGGGTAQFRCLAWRLDGECVECGERGVTVVSFPSQLRFDWEPDWSTAVWRCVRCNDWTSRPALHPGIPRRAANYRKGQLQKAVAKGMTFKPAPSLFDDDVGQRHRGGPPSLLADAREVAA